MPTYRDEGLVLRTHKLGEVDRIITLLTARHGKVRAVARGVRRTSSRFGARMEPFMHVDVQFAQGRSLEVVCEAVYLNTYGISLIRDYAAFTAGEVMLETADRLVAEEGEPAPAQFRLLLGALRVLVQGTADGWRPPTMILDSYLLRALSVAGYAPVLDACARCGSVGPHQGFAPSAGGMVCLACRAPGTARPSEQGWELLRALLVGDWPATREVSAAVQAEVSGLVAAFAGWHLDHALRSLPLVERELV